MRRLVLVRGTLKNIMLYLTSALFRVPRTKAGLKVFMFMTRQVKNGLNNNQKFI
jgi:hypothetical protein